MLRLALRLLTATFAALSLVAERRAEAEEQRERDEHDADLAVAPVARVVPVVIEYVRETADGWSSESWERNCASQDEADALLAGWVFGGAGGDC